MLLTDFMNSSKITPKVVIVMPAYNAEKTLERTYRDIPKNLARNVIVVDDDSRDKTVVIAKKLHIDTVVHPKNLGYGGNQKTCYREALMRGADIVIMIHPDYQYDATLATDLIKPIVEERFDIMLGSRIRSRSEALKGGMPFYKYVSNRVLTFLENIVLGLNMSEYHTGYRAFSKKVLQKLDFGSFSDDFIFDQQILIAAHFAGFTIGEIAVPVRYFPDASSINFIRSFRYGVMILFTLLMYILAKTGVSIKLFKSL